jgi:hypothetical protein
MVDGLSYRFRTMIFSNICTNPSTNMTPRGFISSGVTTLSRCLHLLGSFWWCGVFKPCGRFRQLAFCLIALLGRRMDECGNQIHQPLDLYHLPVSGSIMSSMSSDSCFVSSIHTMQAFISGLLTEPLFLCHQNLQNFPHHVQSPTHSSLILKSKYTAQLNAFGWLLLGDRLNTKGILQRHNMQINSTNCILCNSDELNTSDLLFWSCNFSPVCRATIGMVLLNIEWWLICFFRLDRVLYGPSH